MVSSPISIKHALAPSARFSTPNRPLRPVVVFHKHGALRRFCVAGLRPRHKYAAVGGLCLISKISGYCTFHFWDKSKRYLLFVWFVSFCFGFEWLPLISIVATGLYKILCARRDSSIDLKETIELMSSD